MKKTYMTPSTSTVQVQLHNMIATSGPNGSKVFTQESAGADVRGLSRSNNSDWDDED